MSRNVELHSGGEAIAPHIAHGHAGAIDQLRGDDADRGFDAMGADADPARLRERDGHADGPVPAHVEDADVVEVDDTGDALRLARFAQQRPDQDIRSSGLVDDARSKVIVIRPKTFEAIRDAAAAKVRASFDHHTRRLTRGVRVDNLYPVHAHGNQLRFASRYSVTSCQAFSRMDVHSLVEFRRSGRCEGYFHKVFAEKHVATEYLANLAKDTLTHARPVEL